MPNPWDRGSALALERMGFPALATTSAGLGRSLGKNDQEVTREELVRHVAELTSVISVPLNVDSERLFPEDHGGIAGTVKQLADAGAAGCSIEDYDPLTRMIDNLDKAVAAVETAVDACREHGLVLTARAENHLYGVGDFADTLKRLEAFRDAGADVLYAPGLVEADQIEGAVGLGLPLNVLLMENGPAVEELRTFRVRRISTGSALFNAARQTLESEAGKLLD